MSMFDHESKMYRFPSFHESNVCDQGKTAQESLRDILAKWPSHSSQGSSRLASSPPSSSSSSTLSAPPLPAPLPSATASQPKRPSNASDYKWINAPRSSASSASSKSSSSSGRNRQGSQGSTGGRKSPSSR